MNAFLDAWTWLTTADHWAGPGGIWTRLGEHLYLTGVSMVIACVLTLPLALWLGHTPVASGGGGRGKRLGSAVAVNITNAGRAVPTFAVLVVLMLTPLGEGGVTTPTVIALVLFALPPLLTNAYVGAAEADPDVVEAARGMGMSSRQLMLRIELPLAFPMVMTGIRTATVQVVATATLAALVGGGGLGRIITAGFANQNTAQVVAGAVLVAALALVVEGVLVVAQRLLTPGRGTGARDRAAREELPAEGREDGARAVGAPSGTA
ncbi:ABC transporter permease subunit [Streptomyces spiramenti]|uniref:ABC transporter permease n=1 Tax=Streptomyces spiramenti TaxID=2720606 RepID=A0ABX1AUX5_9ACTN|nr:ABC transporter permease [Streptomyces spiramenti]